MIFNRFLLVVLTLICSGYTRADNHPKSLVLKDHSPQRSPFHLQFDNSREELWNEFMLVKNANSGDPVAQHELGLRYLTGNGFSADTEKAVYWIRKAADQNLITARYNLGILLNNGVHVGWNPFEAYRHFQYAAEHGMAEAQYVYGLLLTDNLTVPRDYVKAYRWITMAADSGYVPAQEVLAEFKRKGIKIESFQSEDTAKPSPARRNGSTSSTSTGQPTSPALQPVTLDFGSDSIVVPDHKELLQEALLEANAQLKDHLLNLKIDKPAGETDSTHVRAIFESAEAGNPEALTLIGFWYQEGLGVKHDIVLATVYYLRAIRLESPSAASLLWKLIQDKNYFPLLKNRIQANDPAAQFSWAGLSAFGFDHQLTENQTLEFLRQAGQQNFVPATVELGIRSYNGKDRENAIQLFRQAAQMGSREAQLRLATMKLTASNNSTPDSTLMNVVWRSTEDGSVLAQEMLGYFYQVGVGVSRSISESVEYYRKAAQRGSRVAYSALRNLYDERRPKDTEFQILD